MSLFILQHFTVEAPGLRDPLDPRQAIYENGTHAPQLYQLLNPEPA